MTNSKNIDVKLINTVQLLAQKIISLESFKKHDPIIVTANNDSEYGSEVFYLGENTVLIKFKSLYPLDFFLKVEFLMGKFYIDLMIGKIKVSSAKFNAETVNEKLGLIGGFIESFTNSQKNKSKETSNNINEQLEKISNKLSSEIEENKTIKRDLELLLIKISPFFSKGLNENGFGLIQCGEYYNSYQNESPLFNGSFHFKINSYFNQLFPITIENAVVNTDDAQNIINKLSEFTHSNEKSKINTENGKTTIYFHGRIKRDVMNDFLKYLLAP